ncbi:MAG: hypothetical protein KJ767_02900 [Nanoarchaeota archaeon]|nr:hypothetical protein [Nanoarchaeota archaeon]
MGLNSLEERTIGGNIDSRIERTDEYKLTSAEKQLLDKYIDLSDTSNYSCDECGTCNSCGSGDCASCCSGPGD